MSSGLDSLLSRRRPSAWQLFIRQPCVYLARLLYSWRRVVPAQPITNPVHVVCTSDTHNNSQPALPDGDVLIHAGDLTQSGTLDELQKTLDWLHRQPHAIKIAVAGNHDMHLSEAGAADLLDWGDVVYLENAETIATCANGRKLRIYGSPLSPRHGNWAFQYPRWTEADPWAVAEGDSMDILVTHAPPQAHLDLGLGCRHLVDTLWRVRPRLHVFGHVHEGAGSEWVQYDGLQAAYEKTVRDRGGVVNLLLVLWHLLLHLWRPTAEAGSLLVNAAMVGGLWDTERRRPVRVII